MSSSYDFNSSHDPYERVLQQQRYQKSLIQMDHSSKFARKLNKLKQLGAATKTNMLNGFMMGSMIGGLFGLVIGIYSAFQQKRLIAIPISIIVSGGSFGFILGIGSAVRNDTIGDYQRKLMENKQVPQQLRQQEWLQIYQFNQKSKSLAKEYF